jgi:hypothetical protein
MSDSANSRKFAKIYGIIDPETEKVVYIGKANDVNARWKTHLSDCRHKKSHLYSWMKERFNSNKPICIIELASAISDDWQSLEVAMIAQYRAEGEILNMADGGEQPFHNQAVCRKNAAKLNERRKNDPLFNRVWEIKRAMGSHLKFLRREGADPEVYQKIVAKLKYCAQKRPDLFGCWSAL